MSAGRCYALAGVLAFASLALAALILWRFFSAVDDPARFLAPGRGSVEVTEPGRYVIWHEHRTVFGGRSYDLSAAMPDGTRYRVVTPGGGNAAVEAYRGATMSNEASVRASLARFVAAAPGRHEVEVEGNFGPRVIAVQADVFWPAVRAIGAAIAAAVIGCGAASAVALYALLGSAPMSPRDAGVADAGRERSLKELTAIVYGLQAASLLVGVTFLAAVLVNYLKRGEVAGTWLESHFAWQIRTFWWSLLWAVLGLATLVFLVGIAILLASAVWFIYRVVKGWTSLEDGRPMYV